jgi:hypothetical protein
MNRAKRLCLFERLALPSIVRQSIKPRAVFGYMETEKPHGFSNLRELVDGRMGPWADMVLSVCFQLSDMAKSAPCATSPSYGYVHRKMRPDSEDPRYSMFRFAEPYLDD